jgi:hypothetical protein
MHSKIKLLNEFYSTIDREQVKIETKIHGFDYLSTLRNMAVLDYCELKNGVYKYRLSKVKIDLFMVLLNDHLAKKINLCTYFHKENNNLFALNLDFTSAWVNKIKIAALFMADNLMKIGITPLIIKSGHGYHIWCRISDPVKNIRLQAFMTVLTNLIVSQMNEKGLETSDLQCTCYPRPNVSDVSIRLFGSEHMKTGMFSSIITQINAEDAILSEEESWSYFERYMNESTVTREHFEKVVDDLIKDSCRQY